MRFWLRADCSPEIGAGHAMRMIGLAERLLADGHEVWLGTSPWPTEVSNKCPPGLMACLTPPSEDAIEVVDSYTLMPRTRNALEIANKPWWFLRNELKAIKPRLRTKLGTLGVSDGGLPQQSPKIDTVGPMTIITPSFAEYPSFLDSCDMIFGAFGVSSWERAYLGIPSIGYVKAENQQENAFEQTQKLMAFCVGSGTISPPILASTVELLEMNPELVELMSRKCLEHVKEDSYGEFWKLVNGAMN